MAPLAWSKTKLLALLALIGMSVLVAGSNATAQSAVKTFSLEDYLPDIFPITAALERMATDVAQTTHGSVQIKVYPNGELIGESAAVAAIRSGSIPIGIGGVGNWANVLPGVAYLSAPFAMRSWPQFKAVISDPKVFAFLDDYFHRSGVKFLGLFVFGPTQMLTQKPIQTIDDFKGVKIRVPPAELYPRIISSVGGVPVVLNTTDTYTALQLHTIQAVGADAAFFQQTKMYELAKYETQAYLWPAWFLLGMNDKAWSSLSPAEQRALGDAARKAALASYDLALSRDRSATAYLKSKGVTVYEISDFGPWAARSAGVTAALLADDNAKRLKTLVDAAIAAAAK